MKSFKIKIEGQQFKNDYLVYIISIETSSDGIFYYVGQTGDRNYLTARPAFRRLAAHFSDQGYSTENQVYRALAVKVLKLEHASQRKTFNQDIKNKVALLLLESKIQMHVFPLAEFEDEATIEEHKMNREFSEKIESEVITYLIQEGKIILNKRLPKNQKNSFDFITLEIIKDLKSSENFN